jgi:tRNA dimethylallyltransferase
MRSIGDSGDADQSGRPIRVIVGPTAAGKSALAMHLARQANLAIISADSRQVYTGFDIGTAKPSMADRESVPHFGIDVIEPTSRYSAHAWAAQVPTWQQAANASGRDVVVVGGTGFYVRALVQPLDAVPDIPIEQRRALDAVIGKLDRDTLARWCRRLDPSRAHLGRTQLLRAIETVLLTGSRITEAFASRSNARAVRYLVIDPGDRLAQNIEQRVATMIEGGWVDEVRGLMESVPEDAPAWLASGYGRMREHVQGRITLEEAARRIVIETRQYAKRQRTWFRHQLADGTVERIDPFQPGAHHRVLQWWNRGTDPS